jgi:hypothetical protein
MTARHYNPECCDREAEAVDDVIPEIPRLQRTTADRRSKPPLCIVLLSFTS